MVTFDTNVLVYATTAAPDAKAKRSRDLIVRGMQSGWSILLLQTLAEDSDRRHPGDDRCLACGAAGSSG